MRASWFATSVVSLCLAAGAIADEELPDDEFLEFLGAWDEVWSEVCDPEGDLPGDDACETDDDEQDDDSKD